MGRRREPGKHRRRPYLRLGIPVRLHSTTQSRKNVTHYSIERLSRLTGVTMRQAQVWSELGILSRDLDPERLHHWLIAADLRRRGLPLALVARVIQTWRRTRAPFVVVDRDRKTVLALETAAEVLKRFAGSGSGGWMLVDLR